MGSAGPATTLHALCRRHGAIGAREGLPLTRRPLAAGPRRARQLGSQAPNPTPARPATEKTILPVAPAAAHALSAWRGNLPCPAAAVRVARRPSLSPRSLVGPAVGSPRLIFFGPP